MRKSARGRAAKSPHLRWGTERRLAFIEFRLCWEGRINRADLVEFFGISVPQASTDLKNYRALAPGNVDYDATRRQYVATPAFSPVFVRNDPASYLNELSALDAGLLDSNSAFVGYLPEYGVVPPVTRRIDSGKFRALLGAVRAGVDQRIRYQSMSKPDATWRWIRPLAFVSDGYRWHVRSFCHNQQDFRDFVIARMLDVGDQRPSDVDPGADREWQEFVTVRIAPHPGLSEGQKRAVELDYAMEGGEQAITVRRAMLFYFRKRLRLDWDNLDRTPVEQQIVALNADELGWN